jgi:Flp pilus assembly protein CpaB
MRPVNPTSRRGVSLGTVLLLLFAFLLVGGGGTVATLFALGVPLPFLNRQPVLVRIPANFRPIAALSTVTREDLINPEARAIASIEMRPEQTIGISLTGISESGQKVQSRVAEAIVVDGAVVFVTPEGERVPATRVAELGGALMNPSDIIGRVLARDKTPMLAFRSDLFLPAGTRPGVAGGIPAGMQALTIEASLLDGAHSLKAGDRVDLMATIPDEHLPRFGGSDKSRLPGAALVVLPGAANRDRVAGEARLLAEDAVLVTPVRMRAEPLRSSSLTQGTQVRNVPVQEVVLAVQRDDVPSLAEALALNVQLVCIARSGRPGAEAEEQPPEGLVAVPVSARPVAALSQLVRDDIFHPRTRRQRFIYLTPEEVAAKQIVTSYTDLVGRVAAHDILAGHFVTSSDLLPPGTPPGLAAGVPPGKRAFVVDAAKFRGLAALAAGDRFDLLASSPVDLSRAARGTQIVGAGGLAGALPKQADVRVLVHEGVVVAPLPSAPRKPGESAATSDVVVAVDPSEAPIVAEALATGVELTIVARSALRPVQPAATPALPAEDRTPEHHPLADVRSLEVVVGGKRETVHFLGSGERVVANRPNLDEPATPIQESQP